MDTFLGGTCVESAWRNQLKVYLENQEIEYYDPIITNRSWTEQDRIDEQNAKANCKYLIYVITPRQQGMYSFAEIMESCVTSKYTNQKTIFCYLYNDTYTQEDLQKYPNLVTRQDGNFLTWTDAEKKSLEAIGKLVEVNNGIWIKFSESTENTLHEIAVCIKEQNSTVSKNRPKILLFDFDNTICKNGFPDITTGTLITGAKETINKLYDEGFYIIIWTARFLENHITDTKNFLDSNGIKYHSINKNYPYLDFQPYPKVFGDYLKDDNSVINLTWENTYEFIKTKLAESDIYEITNEMKDWYYWRTINHIYNVKEYWNTYFNTPECILDNQYIDQINDHDSMKFSTEELSGYIAVTWNYKCKNNDIEFIKSQEIDDLMYNVTNHHIINNKHHPEAWCGKTENLISKTERDNFNPLAVETLDATTMPDNYLIEMVCDWCATGDERNNSARSWADKVINTRWKFSDIQKDLIYSTIDLLQPQYKPSLFNQNDYEQYIEWCNVTEYGEKLYENKLTDKLMDVIEFIKQIASLIKLNVKDLFKLFTNTEVYKFFAELDWSYDSFIKVISVGGKIVNTLLNPLQGILSIIFPDILAKGVVNSKGFKLAKDQLKGLQQWAKDNKKLLMISGIAFAGLYLIMWVTMAQTGDIAYDFDLSDLLKIIAGSLTLYDFIFSEDGIKMVVLFFIGLITGGFALNIAGNSVSFLIAFITTIGKQINIKISKGNSKQDVIELENLAIS